ncbi:MAG: radical SAM protein [Polyangiaceae bacterium]
MRSLPQVRPKAAPKSVRISLTDRCDLACVYCRPHRHERYLEERLDLDSWKSMVRGLVRAGIRRVRITGGEPLLHPQLLDMVSFLASVGLDDLALTTNATRLEKLANPLREAGLQRLNLSLDSLDPAVFARLTRGGDLGAVLRGVDAAVQGGFAELKLNAVVVRGENDRELERLVHFCWERDITPRFLEIMSIGDGATMMDKLVTVREMRETLRPLLAHDDPPVPEADRGPARYIRSRDGGAKRVGFISGTSDTFCAACDRLRVASDGVLRPCLATNEGVSAAADARAGDAESVARKLDVAWESKPDGTTWKGCTEPTASLVSIRHIGG